MWSPQVPIPLCRDTPRASLALLSPGTSSAPLHPVPVELPWAPGPPSSLPTSQLWLLQLLDPLPLSEAGAFHHEYAVVQWLCQWVHQSDLCHQLPLLHWLP